MEGNEGCVEVDNKGDDSTTKLSAHHFTLTNSFLNIFQLGPLVFFFGLEYLLNIFYKKKG